MESYIFNLKSIIFTLITSNLKRVIYELLIFIFLTS